MGETAYERNQRWRRMFGDHVTSGLQAIATDPTLAYLRDDPVQIGEFMSGYLGGCINLVRDDVRRDYIEDTGDFPTPDDPFGLDLWGRQHSDYCGCWMCEGREPDTYYEDLSELTGRKCANCGESLTRNDGGTVHTYCEADFIAYLNREARNY